jgi:hypothetical protein
MKVAFNVFFPIVHPVTAAMDWYTAVVFQPDLDLPIEEVFRIAEYSYLTGPYGSLASVFSLVRQLQLMTNEEPVTILWGSYASVALPTVYMNYDEGKVTVNGNEFRADSLFLRHDDIDWKAEFVKCLE